MRGAALWLLLALPLGAAGPAPAVSPGDEIAAPADETPSARELRRMRRAERRARRRANRRAHGSSDDADASQTEKSGSTAVQNALQMGETLKSSLKSGEASALPEAAGAGAGVPREAGESDLIAAVQSGYQAAPAAVGLVLERGAFGSLVLKRADGKPVTQEDLAALRRTIESEPRALMRRPDFFAVIPRPRYETLKEDHRGKPELKTKAFQDVGLTDKDRDFVWERTCAKVSGECNPAAREGSYKKDAEVAPEDLASIWSRIYGAADSLAESALGAEPAGSGLSGRPGLRSRLLSRLLAGAGSFGEWLSGQEPRDDLAGVATQAGGGAQSRPRSQDEAGAGGLGPSASAPQVVQARRAARARRRQAGAGLGLLAACGLLWLALRRPSS